MKLGVGFNVFSGAEFLKPALINVRKFAHYIVVTYTLISIAGTKAPKYLLPLLKQLKKEKLIDVLIEIKPQIRNNGVEIQNIKRSKYEYARNICVELRCTHFMARDCDEFYSHSEFLAAMKISEKYDLTISPIIDYVQNPTMRARTINSLYVPFIHNINCNYTPTKFPVKIDFSRTVSANTYFIFTNEIKMHHFTGVRYNSVELARKFEGHSHFTRLGKAEIKKYVKDIKLASNKVYDVVSDKFGINKYWNNEFSKFYNKYMK